MNKLLLRALLCLLALPVSAESIAVGTYNIENFHTLFEAHRLRQIDGFRDDPRVKDMVSEERRQNEEDQWEVAQVILDPAFFPDVLLIQEGCRQADLEYFNRRWLGKAYETIIVFPSNTERDQHVGVLLKPGYKVIERRDQYHLEEDVVPNDRDNRLFARGPAFVLVESPTGYRFWVGTTHQKSKGGNSVKVAQWRNREAQRTHEIMKQLASAGPEDVLLAGDMNDEIGIQEFEDVAGDAMATLVGPPDAGFVLATAHLAKSGQQSFGGYWNPRYRSFIDHIVLSPGMKDQVQSVALVRHPLAPVASDHYPVLIRLTPDAPPAVATDSTTRPSEANAD